MKKYLCREGLYLSGTYFIVEASSEEQLLNEFGFVKSTIVQRHSMMSGMKMKMEV